MTQVHVIGKTSTTSNSEKDLGINNLCRGNITPEQKTKIDSLTPAQKEVLFKFVHQYKNVATDPYAKKIVEARNQGLGAFNKTVKDFTSAALYDSKHSWVDNPFAFGQDALYS